MKIIKSETSKKRLSTHIKILKKLKEIHPAEIKSYCESKNLSEEMKKRILVYFDIEIPTT